MSDTTHHIFQQLLENDATLKLTGLRKDILSIFIDSKKAMSAYDVLAILKKRRDNAEPMTVYRVIEYLISRNIIHRINTENKYVFCSQAEHNSCQHRGLFFICKKCLSSFEVMDEKFDILMQAISQKYHFLVDPDFVEIKGICQHCSNET